VTPFWRSVAATLALLGGALALERAHPSHGWTAVPGWLGSFARDLTHHGLNAEDDLDLLAGYYEDLLNASNDATAKRDPEEGWRGSIRLDETHERVAGFLWYRPRAGLDLVTAAGTRVVTSAHGLADREYELAKPAGTRRIAFVGDSLVRGLGAPFGRALEPRFEEWLNATQTDPAIARFEVLNFGVEGYRLTQLLDVALGRAPAFQPDVLLLGLSELGVWRNFGNHLARLVHEGIDLEYPFLRDLVRRAGVAPDDEIGEAESKLTRVRAEIVRGCLQAIVAGMRERSIALVAVLLPTVNDAATQQERFVETRAILSELEIPALDLLDTFAGVQDLAALRVSRVDHHPNEAGCGRLLERLQARLAEAPAAAELLLGRPLRR